MQMDKKKKTPSFFPAFWTVGCRWIIQTPKIVKTIHQENPDFVLKISEDAFLEND